MALAIGTTSVANNTLAGALYDGINDMFGAVTGESDTLRREICVALATGVINHFLARAEIEVTVTTSDSALQRVGGVDTQAPSANRTLGGTLS